MLGTHLIQECFTGVRECPPSKGGSTQTRGQETLIHAFQRLSSSETFSLIPSEIAKGIR